MENLFKSPQKRVKIYTDPVAKTPHSQCRGPGFDPWSENHDPTCPQLKIQHMATKIPHVTTKNPAQSKNCICNHI